MKRRQAKKIMTKVTGYEVALGKKAVFGRWKLSTINEAIRVYERGAKRWTHPLEAIVYRMTMQRIAHYRWMGKLTKAMIATGFLQIALERIIGAFDDSEDEENETRTGEGDRDAVCN